MQLESPEDSMLRLSTVLLALIGSMACGGSSPTSPTPDTPNYAGSWTGTYAISSCTQTGGVADANVCGALGGSTQGFSMQLSQSGSNVTGSFNLGTAPFTNASGTVAADGGLELRGNGTASGIAAAVTWSLRMPASSLTGSVAQAWTSSALTGQATVAGSITSATR
jgi:hypothetical protein